MAGKLEVHRHCFVSGDRARKSWLSELTHSHEGGDQPHEHPDTGPAAYTIDKDEWFRATGLRGGGRKKFTAGPSGEQFPIVAIAPERLQFDVIVCEKPATGPLADAHGGGYESAQRMQLAFGMRANVKPGSAA